MDEGNNTIKKIRSGNPPPPSYTLVVQNFFYYFFIAWKWSKKDKKLIKEFKFEFENIIFSASYFNRNDYL